MSANYCRICLHDIDDDTGSCACARVLHDVVLVDHRGSRFPQQVCGTTEQARRWAASEANMLHLSILSVQVAS